MSLQPINSTAYFGGLPVASVSDNPSLLTCDASGNLKRLALSSMETLQQSAAPTAVIESDWIRVAILGTFTSSSCVFAGDIYVYTPWNSAAMTLLHFSLAFCTAAWDYNKGNATEKLNAEPRLNMTSPFTKARLVVEAGGGNVKTVYLEVFHGSTSTYTDYRRPYLKIHSVYDSTNSAKPITAVAGSVPSGAIVSQEFNIVASS